LTQKNSGGECPSLVSKFSKREKDADYRHRDAFGISPSLPVLPRSAAALAASSILSTADSRSTIGQSLLVLRFALPTSIGSDNGWKKSQRKEPQTRKITASLAPVCC
jgi:hypothetical protein